MKNIRCVWTRHVVTALFGVVMAGCSADDSTEAWESVVAAEKQELAGLHCVHLALLSGSEEVPPRDTNARGLSVFHTNRSQTSLHFKLPALQLESPVSAHIHLGAKGMNGPVVALLAGPFASGGGERNGILGKGEVTASDLQEPLAGQPLSALIDAMQRGNAYVNVHTDDGAPPPNTGPGDFAAGEIRGQIRGVGHGCQ